MNDKTDTIDSGMNYGTKFILSILEGIKGYSEMYAIMQGFRSLVSSMVDLEIEIPLSIKEMVYEELNNFIEGKQILDDEGDVEFEYQSITTDDKLRFLDFMEDLGLIEKACIVIEKLVENTSQDDAQLEELIEKKKYLNDLSI